MPDLGRYFPIQQSFYWYNDRWRWPWYWPRAYFLHLNFWEGPATHPPEYQIVELFAINDPIDGYTIDWEGVLPDSGSDLIQFRLTYIMAERVEDGAFSLHMFWNFVEQFHKQGFPLVS